MYKIFFLLLINFNLFSQTFHKQENLYTASEVPKKMTLQVKKERFFALLVPAVEKAHKNLFQNYIRIKKEMKNGTNIEEIDKLKKRYRVKSDLELLYALKPHPQSLTLAQAAIESSWGTSRFFVKANNIFGMWSVNKHEKRIPARFKRNGVKTIWLRKFDSLEESVEAYYFLMGRAKAYKRFRKVCYETNNVHKMVKKLDKYSELGAEYGRRLSGVIRYNKLQKYDTYE